MNHQRYDYHVNDFLKKIKICCVASVIEPKVQDWEQKA